MRTANAILIGALAFGIAWADEEATDVTVCQIASHPLDYAGKLVRVRGRILIAFERFEFSATECKEAKLEMTWLEYGRGPKHQPTIWCCGDLTPRDPLALVQDANFKKFHRLLTAQTRNKNCNEGQCYWYEVTATLTGRLDTAATKASENGSMRCEGFGHLGMACSRLVIQSVADVVAKDVRSKS